VKKKISISDIAKKFHISITTVSFILNGKSKEYRISDDLVKNVKAYINEVGYKPSQLAQSLRTGKTKIIGLMVEDISNPFFATIARLIEEMAYESGYKILYCSTDNDTEKTRELIGMFIDRHVDGYIITPSAGIEKDIMNLIDGERPVVLFDRFFADVNTNYVVIDNAGSAYTATNHLINRGFKNIAFVTLDSDQSQMLDRKAGYEKALLDHQLPHIIKTIPFHTEHDNAVDEIVGFLKNDPQIDAVFFGTNYLAISGLEAIKRLDLRIPKSIGIVAFDDHDLFRLHSPTISAIAQPVEQIAARLIQVLLAKLCNAPESNQNYILPTSLIVRESS
jgi:LacI family transcriptional regulator